MITYLQCNSNNLAAIVPQLFINAISFHGLLPRVRAGSGVKNVNVARFILDSAERGINRGGFIAGTSIHNQRREGYKVRSNTFP